ncbi:MAG: hypothetical protein JXN61_03955, partial [Sedimentisphaerales bacterium]|nr:hypothetical protein [Sedimentisphaerales bacterium]
MGKCGTESLFGEMDSRLRGNDSGGDLRLSGHESSAGRGHIVRVAFESAADAEFDYLVPDGIWPIAVGQRVEVPFGRKNKAEFGFCTWADVPKEESFLAVGRGRKLKTVSKVADEGPLIDAELMELARWISSYYVCPLGQVLAAMVPGAVKKGAGVKTQKYVYLAEGTELTIEGLRGGKQRLIADFLRGRQAVCADSGLEVQTVLDAVGCGAEPLKRLAEKGIVKIGRRQILSALPAIPEGLAIPTQEVTLNEDQKKVLAHLQERIESGE